MCQRCDHRRGALVVATVGTLWALAATTARADANESTGARPPLGDLTARLETLVRAIAEDAPGLASDVFFPREPFLKVKAIADPGAYYDKLRARFVDDIHALHRTLGNAPKVRFSRFEFSKRGGFVRPGEEANRLPYWASRHSYLYYRVGAEERRIEVRVLITWAGRWYVIHLNEFKTPPAARAKKTAP